MLLFSYLVFFLPVSAYCCPAYTEGILFIPGIDEHGMTVRLPFKNEIIIDAQQEVQGLNVDLSFDTKI